MSYKTSFLDGEEYGAADLNEITARLVTSGIADSFEDGVPYNVRHLNNLITGIVGAGVADANDTNLKVIYNNGSYYIQPGLAFFGNGSTLEVLTAEKIIKTENAITYVYLVSDATNNRNYIAVSDIAPDITDDNIVYLAEISTDGTITDRRVYAVGKVVGYQNEYNGLKKQEISHEIKGNYRTPTPVIQELSSKTLKFMIVLMDRIMGVYIPDENKKVCCYRRNSNNYLNSEEVFYVGRASGGNEYELLDINNMGNGQYQFSYGLVSGGSETSNNYGTLSYTIYYV